MISRTTKSFWRHYDNLPEAAQRQADRAFALWRRNPHHPSLQFKCISDKHSAFSARVGLHWRALGYRDAAPTATGEDMVTWFWIGVHAEYDRLIGGL